MKQEKQINKILLVNPPSTVYLQSNKTRCLKDGFLPIGLAYLSAQISKNYKVKVYDMTIEGFHNEIKISDEMIYFGATLEDYIKVLNDFKPDLVGVSCLFSNKLGYVLDICKKTKEFNKDIVTITGGYHVTGLPQSVLKEDVDFAMLGESDLSFPKLIETLNNKGNLKEVDGLAHKENGKLIIQPQVFINDLDKLPFPDWDTIGIEKYYNLGTKTRHGVPIKEERYIPIITSRGCPQNCYYCAVPKHTGLKIRKRSIKNVIEEVGYVIKKYGAKEIYFEDDNFFVDKERVKEICRELISNFNEITFMVPSGTDLVDFDYELIDLLKKARFTNLMLGIETGDLELQKKYVGKKLNLEKIKGFIKYMNKIGLRPQGMFLIGFPDETKEQIKRTSELAKSLGFWKISLGIVNPLAGSKLYDYCIENDLLYDDFNFVNMNFARSYIRNPNLTREEIEGVRINTWKEYQKELEDKKRK